MPELVINVPSYIGESHMDWDACEWVQGITWADIDMQLWWAEAMGEKADSILLRIGACDGGSVLEGFNIINNLHALKLPIRSQVSGYAASMAVPLAMAADVAPEMDYTAQLMFHAASFNGGVGAETSKDLRAAADQLDNVNQLVLDYMVARTGQTAETVTEWMSKDTWFTATQAQAVGMCSKVNPLPTATTPAAATALITARRRRVPVAAARAATYALAARKKPTPKALTPAARRAALKPRPMATTPAKKPATTPAAKILTSAPSAASIAAVKAFAQQMGVNITAEGDAPEAVAVATVLADGAGTLYTDGPLAQGSAVFNDEALTEATDDATYEAEDGREIIVAGGTVESISEASAEGNEEQAPAAISSEAITAAVTAALAPLTQRLETIEAKFNKTVPPTPRPTARASASGQADPKNAGAKKPHPMDKAKSN
ncbi:ATP-dependent Clp protease proteolytic subunit [Hymenobacter glacieicola]|uniref:ATP-dependent Clp protease proteolytic subunit n=1 Tax=Hymenobacter glacieicola TaxID=1562124 RepID=A0ABQ1WJR1_9BACT|nr:ATP-dependent Clp protease proteolytic subunit [Hymenobacter glacieicola]GGG34203.1 hypothetical protein GCM10011378_08270 [Hymenobacter glacieicola]